MQRELIERAQRGDAEAFRDLVHEAGHRLHAIAYRILRDSDRAEDALQQALIDLPGRTGIWLVPVPMCRGSVAVDRGGEARDDPRGGKVVDLDGQVVCLFRWEDVGCAVNRTRTQGPLPGEPWSSAEIGQSDMMPARSRAQANADPA